MRISDWISDVCSSDLFMEGKLEDDNVAAKALARAYGRLGIVVAEARRDATRRSFLNFRAAKQVGIDQETALRASAAMAAALERVDQLLPIDMDCDVLPKLRESQEKYIAATIRSEEHTSELQSLMRISYA